MCTYEFFPKNYNVLRRDHNVDGVEVYVEITDRITSYEISDLDTDCDIVRAGLHFQALNHCI